MKMNSPPEVRFWVFVCNLREKSLIFVLLLLLVWTGFGWEEKKLNSSVY